MVHYCIYKCPVDKFWRPNIRRTLSGLGLKLFLSALIALISVEKKMLCFFSVCGTIVKPILKLWPTLILWSRVDFEKPRISQQLKKLPGFCVIQRFVTVKF